MPADSGTLDTVRSVTQSGYKWGFETDIEMDVDVDKRVDAQTGRFSRLRDRLTSARIIEQTVKSG